MKNTKYLQYNTNTSGSERALVQCDMVDKARRRDQGWVVGHMQNFHAGDMNLPPMWNQKSAVFC